MSTTPTPAEGRAAFPRREHPKAGLQRFECGYDGLAGRLVCHVDYTPEADGRGDPYYPSEATVEHVFAADSDFDLSAILNPGVIKVLEAEALAYFDQEARGHFSEPDGFDSDSSVSLRRDWEAA